MRIEPREPFMDLSIIYANWNSMDYLCRCVVRIYEHTGGISFEIIAVGSASPAMPRTISWIA
jgi:hypothetical protein